LGLHPATELQRWNYINYIHDVLHNPNKLVHKILMNNNTIAKEKHGVNILEYKPTFRVKALHSINNIVEAYSKEKIKTFSSKKQPNPPFTDKTLLDSKIIYAAFDGSFKNGAAGSAAIIKPENGPIKIINSRPNGIQTSATAETHALLNVL